MTRDAPVEVETWENVGRDSKSPYGSIVWTALGGCDEGAIMPDWVLSASVS